MGMGVIIDKDKSVKMFSVTLLFVQFVLFTLFLPDAMPENRIAMVIGNGAYSSDPLNDSPNDAQLMFKTLRSLGFKVMIYKDLNQNEIKKAVLEFGRRLEAKKDSVGLFYYSGHGMQIEGRNYMIPLGLTINHEDDVLIFGVGLQDVLTRMKYAGNRMNFMVLDACRENPFEKKIKSTAKGLGRMDTPRGVLIAYAAEPHKVALQGRGKYSIFTEAVAREMVKPGVTVEKMFKNVRIAVNNETDGRQLPVTDSQLLDHFYFLPPQKNSFPNPNISRIDGKIVRKITRDEHFMAFDNGVVRDTDTGLDWLAAPKSLMTWEETISWVESLRTRSSEWRMPTKMELKTLYKYGKGIHNMSPLLKSTGWWVWAREKRDSNSAWGFNFENGQEVHDFCDSSLNKSGLAVRVRSRSNRYWQPPSSILSPKLLRNYEETFNW